LTHRDQKPVENQPITAKDPVEKNLQRLSDDADLVRLFAGQALRQQIRSSGQSKASFDAHVQQLAKDPSRGLEQLELSWVLEGLGDFDPTLQKALFGSNDGRLRAAYTHQIANQIRWVKTSQYGSLDPSQIGLWAALGKRLVQDEHPRVRLEAVRLLSQLPSVESAQAACLALHKPMDRFLDFALWQTMRDLASVWLPEFRSGKFRFGNDPSAIAFALKAVEDPSTIDAVLTMLDEKLTSDSPADAQAARSTMAILVAELGNGPQQAKLVDRLIDPNNPTALPDEALRGQLVQAVLDASLRRKEPLAVQPSTAQALGQLAEQAIAKDKKNEALGPTDLGLVALRTLGPWRIAGARSRIEAVSQDAASSSAVRVAALRSVANLGDDAAKEVVNQLAQDPNIDVAIAAMERQADSNLGAAAKVLVGRLAKEPTRAEPLSNAAAAFLGRKDGPQNLLAALQGVALDASAARQLKSALRKLNAGGDLIQAIDTAGKLQENRWVLNDELKNQWLELAKTQGDPVQGEWIYRRNELQCIQCHKIGGVGGLVGPDLTSIGAQAPADYLLESLLNPAAKVKEGYNAKLVRTESDEVFAGIPVRESDDEVVLRLADGKEVTIEKGDIQDIKESRSLMPDGLLDSLTKDEAIHLLRFITELGKIDGKMLVANNGAIRQWETLLWTEKAHVLFNRTSLDSIVGDQSNFTWQLHPAMVSGGVPLRSLATFRPHPGVPNHTFLRTKLVITRAGDVVLDFGNAPKGSVSLWANGKPIPVDGRNVKVAMSQGEHWVFVGVNRDLLGDESLSISIDPNGTTAKQ
jgi:putative heme-binding domain-containing protein